MTNEKLYEMISFALNDNAIQTESIFNELIEDIVEDTLVDMQKEIFSEARTKEPGNETDAHELHLFATNDGDLYRRGATPIINNLKRKVKKGVYDHEKAVKLWKYHADNASKKYTKEVAGERHQTHLFSPATRELAARKMADYYKEDIHDTHHTNESVEENIKMDIHVDGKYHSSTTQSKTNKEAKEKFLKAFPQHQGKKIQVTRVNESIDFTEIEEGFAGVKHSGGPLHGKIDKRYSITKEYNGHSSARHVARFAGDYLGSHESREGAQEIAQKHSDLRDRIHSGIHENAIEMGLDLTEDQLEDIVEETLDELSKKTLSKYINQSAQNIRSGSQEREFSIQQSFNPDLKKDTQKAYNDRAKYQERDINNRLKGIRRATLKLANENVDQEEETLDEISKKTLGSYIKKASTNAADKNYIAGHRYGQLAGKGLKYDADNHANYLMDRSYKRKKNINKAVDKLTGQAKVNANENVDQEDSLDEVASNKFVNVATSRKAIRDTQKILNDNPDMMSGHKAEFKRTITIHKKHLEKAGHPFNENIEMEEAVHPDEALRILKKHTDIDNNTNFFSLSSHQINNIEAERKKAKFSGRNSMGRSPTRQFYDHLHKQAAKSSHLMDESFDIEEAVHPADAHRILNSMGGKDADYFTLKSQHLDTLEDERKKAKYSGSNYLGRGKTRQFFYHLQKQAAKYKPYKANESFDMEEETLDESNDFLNEDFEKEQNKLIQMAGVKKKSKDTTTAIASNGDFVVHDRGTVIGRLKKGSWEHHAPSLREYVENSYDAEQEIEELSDKTLKSYLDKATREAARLSLTKNPSDEVKNKFRKRVRGMAKSSKLIKAEESLSNDDRESNESVDIEESKKTYIATIKHTRTGETRKVKFRTSRSPRVEASTKLLNPLEYLHSIDSVKE